jgi:hypothetical protein
VTNDIAEQRRSISADEPDVTRSVAGVSSDVTDLQRGAGETGSASLQVLSGAQSLSATHTASSSKPANSSIR